MRMRASRWFGALLGLAAIGSVGTALANQYPPKSGFPNANGCNAPDTLIRIEVLQDPNKPSLACHPIPPDTVWGVGGIITGFDDQGSGRAIRVQNSDGNPWGGTDVFSGGNDLHGLYGLALGDSVMCYGRVDEFQSGNELRAFTSSAFGAPTVIVRKISSGNPLPPFHLGTTNELQEQNTNLNAEQWEGCLVRVGRTGATTHKLRVVRRSDDQNVDLGLTNSDGGDNNFLAVDNVVCPNGSVGPCDSLFVDGSELTTLTPPPIGALVDSVQGVYEQRSRGYRVMLRDVNDLFDSSPPNLVDAFPIANGDSIRLIFDRNVTTASAENFLNYTVGSTGNPADGAKRQVQHNIVHLKITSGNPMGNGTSTENITATGLVREPSGPTMSGSTQLTFYNGIQPITEIQKPDDAALMGAPCEDRSRQAAAGNQATGKRLSTRGVCTEVMGSTAWIEDAAGGARSGVAVFAPLNTMIVGHKYLFAGGVQEFFEETELLDNVYLKDEGAAAIPAPIVKSVHVLRDTTCDVTKSLDTAEDYEGCLVQLNDVRVSDERSAGQSFFVAGQYPTNPDTILIDNNIARTFDPVKHQYVSVVGIEDVSFLVAGTIYRIQPRGDADITVNTTLSVNDPELPTGVSFRISPNPGRKAQVTFGLPTRQKVSIAVFDLAGRRRALLADGEFPAGTWTVNWDGRDAEGTPAGAGVYFYKMTLGDRTYSKRAILLN